MFDLQKTLNWTFQNAPFLLIKRSLFVQLEKIKIAVEELNDKSH